MKEIYELELLAVLIGIDNTLQMRVKNINILCLSKSLEKLCREWVIDVR